MRDVKTGSAADKPAKVWDAPIRLFHWLLVALIAFSWWSGEEHDMERHRLSGYGILALLVFRIYWGLAGTRTARFSQFVRGPRVVVSYARSLGMRGANKVDGHNPLGGWSVVLMLSALVLMVLAGLFAVDVDGFESGPLADYVTFQQGRAAAEFHVLIFDAILTLIGLHVAAILFYLVWKRQNLVGAMIHGARKQGAENEAAGMRVSPHKLLPGVILAALVAYFASTGLRF